MRAKRATVLPSLTVMNARPLLSRLFVITASLAAVYLLAESVLQFFGRSICATEGCKVVAQFTRFGDLSMALLGFSMFSLLAFLAARGLRSADERRDRLIDILLITSLAGEGFFVGEQLFRLDALCVFCMSVFGIYVLLGVLRVLSGRTMVLAGFGALAAVMSLFYLILPAGGTALPLDQRHTLFYSADCKHCAEIKREIEAQQLEVLHVPVQDHAATLKNLGIDQVPTLFVNGPYEKFFLTGTDAIRRYLASCRAPLAPRRGAPEASPPASRLPLFTIPPSPDALFSPPPDDGLCKEDVKCE